MKKLALIVMLGVAGIGSAAEVCTVDFAWTHPVRIECTNPADNRTFSGSSKIEGYYPFFRDALKEFYSKGYELQSLGSVYLLIKK